MTAARGMTTADGMMITTPPSIGRRPGITGRRRWWWRRLPVVTMPHRPW